MLIDLIINIILSVTMADVSGSSVASYQLCFEWKGGWVELCIVYVSL